MAPCQLSDGQRLFVIKLNLAAGGQGFECERLNHIARGQISVPLFKNGISSV